MEKVNLTTLVTTNNPFNPNDKSILLVPTGATIAEVLDDFEYDTNIYDLQLFANQELVELDYIIQEDDIINFVVIPLGGGGGKNILATIAMIALAVTVPLASTALFGTSIATPGVAGALLTSGSYGTLAVLSAAHIGMMVVGGLLISSVFKPSGSSNSISSIDTSPTYGWNVQGNSLQQGTVVPVLYGTMRVVPQYIGMNLVTSGDHQYLNILLGVAEGPLDYLGDVYINDNPLYSYNDVDTAYRLGTNDQSVLEWWGDTWADQGINKQLVDSDTWVYAETSGDQVTKFIVNLLCPNGLFYANDAGGLDPYTVSVDAEYRKVGDSNWIQLGATRKTHRLWYIDTTPTEIVVGKTPRGFDIITAVPNTTGPYSVVKEPYNASMFTGLVLSGTRTNIGSVDKLPLGVSDIAIYATRVTFGATEVQAYYVDVYEPVGYENITGATTSPIRTPILVDKLEPNKYEVRVKYYSTPVQDSRHASAVVLEHLQEAIEDDFTYPNTALYAVKALATSQISGGAPKISIIASRTTGNLQNPANACLDLLTNSRYGAGVPIERIDTQSFADWAAYCDTEGFEVNIYLDGNITLSEALRTISQLGRGSIMQYGSTFVALVDKPNTSPTQGFLFSMGNIVQSSFTETFLPLKDRANSIEVSYYDKSNNYQRTAVEVTSVNYDQSVLANKVSLDLVGCTDKTQALRQAKYHINQNRYLTITASWEAAIDSISCKVGDIVNVAHDTPQWGYSGRIVSNTNNTITLDREDISMEEGTTYYIQISDSNTDEQLYRQVTSIVGGILTITGDPLPTIGDCSVYAFGEVNRHAKKMRVLSINTASDLKRRITAIEYNNDVFLDTVELPEPTYVSDIGIGDIRISDYIKVVDGSIVTVVVLNWVGSSLSYNVRYREEGSNWIDAGVVRSCSTEILGLQDGKTYEVSVDGKVTTYTVKGKLVPPPPVDNVIGYAEGFLYTITWDYQYKPVDFAYFEVYMDGSTIGTTQAKSFEFTDTYVRTKNFSIVAVDTSGNRSDISETITIPVAPIPIVDNLRNFYRDGRTYLIWDVVEDSRTIKYEIKLDGYTIGSTSMTEFIVPSDGVYTVQSYHPYRSRVWANTTNKKLYSASASTISVTNAVLPENIVASFDEKATGWLGTLTNVFINASGNLELGFDTFDDTMVVDDLEDLNRDGGGVYQVGYYEIPEEHIVDLGEAQVCRIWVEYVVSGVISNSRIDLVQDFDTWSSLDGDTEAYSLTPQIAIAGNDGVFGPWVDFVVGEYIGRKFKFRGVFTSAEQFTSCELSKAVFYVDMPDKLQSGNGVSSGTTIVYPIPFQVKPNVQITIVDAIPGDDVVLQNETETSFDVVVVNGGSPVTRTINWLAKGY